LEIYLVDGTYELFRHYYAVPPARDSEGREVGAVRGVLGSVMGMVKAGATHLAVATDHVVESFRNELWDGYKTSEGVEPDLLAQFPLLEEVLAAAGFVVWPMVEFETDDALAAGAILAARDKRVERVLICTPDKDLGQCVSGTRVVQLHRRTNVILDECGVEQKFGVLPESIPDYLALVGDSAVVLAKWRHIEAIPADALKWNVKVAGAMTLAATLVRDRELALLFRKLATLRTDIPLFEDVDEFRWKGPTSAFAEIGARLDAAVTGKRRLVR
jgi:hypothetical protein